MNRLVPLALVCLLTAACSAPRERPLVRAARPGWGRTHGIEEAVLEVRAVPASLAPRRPAPSLGKPGWGRD